MNNIIISDTSCLIALSRIQRLELLWSLYETIFITNQIAMEYADPLPEWIKLRDAMNSERLLQLQQHVDLGEASAIALALETQDSILIIDERVRKAVSVEL